jgi:hypothetical protein
MTERERFMTTMSGEVPDRIPWFADLSYLYGSLAHTGSLGNQYIGDNGYLQFHRDMGAGVCFYAPFPWKSKYSDDIDFSTEIKSGFRRTSFSTPAGNISSLEKYLPETFSWAITDHLVNNINDLRVMEYIHSKTTYEINYADFNRIDKLWADDGIAAAFPPISSSPLQKLIARWAGIENTVAIMTDYPDEFESLLNSIDESQTDAFEIICGSACQYVEFAENLSSEVTGASLFKKYNEPHYINRNKLLHTAGKHTGIHIDGTLKPCLSMLSGCGFDVAEAVTPFPAGDVKVEDLRKEAGDALIIWGGLPGVLFSPLYTDGQFDNHLKNVLGVFQKNPGFILGVADQVPPDGLIRRIKLVREMIGG